MIRRIRHTLARFRDDRSGSMAIPFALWFPVFAAIMFSAIEIGAISLRHTVLEASLDDAVRQIRLGTNTIKTHDDIKTSICNQATILPNCEATLRLKMVVKDMRNWAGDPNGADCVDVAQPVQPVQSFQNGMANQLMVLQACYRYKPIVAHLGLGALLPRDTAGNTSLISTSAFVQEP